jgi:hypothetical protein
MAVTERSGRNPVAATPQLDDTDDAQRYLRLVSETRRNAGERRDMRPQ